MESCFSEDVCCTLASVSKSPDGILPNGYAWTMHGQDVEAGTNRPVDTCPPDEFLEERALAMKQAADQEFISREPI